MPDTEDTKITITAGNNPPIQTTGKKLEEFARAIKKGGFVQKVTFTGIIKGLSVKATESTPTVTLTIEALGGLTQKAQALIDTMSDGSLIISMTPAQSSLKFGEKPEGAKIEKSETPGKRVRRKTNLKD
jgi:hypothetical protein